MHEFWTFPTANRMYTKSQNYTYIVVDEHGIHTFNVVVVVLLFCCFVIVIWYFNFHKCTSLIVLDKWVVRMLGWRFSCSLRSHIGPFIIVDYWTYILTYLILFFLWIHGILVSVLGATPNHIPLKYRCPIKTSDWIMLVYLRPCVCVTVSFFGLTANINWSFIRWDATFASLPISIEFYKVRCHVCLTIYKHVLHCPYSSK